MIFFKQGVLTSNVQPAIFIAVGIAYALHPHPPNITISSMNDSVHGPGSLHMPANSPDGLCRAVDLRTHDLLWPDAKQWFRVCKQLLEPLGFDVVLHDGTQPGVAQHLHIEYQPKDDEIDWAKGMRIA
jgi:hypothetical protein